jgi:putative ABC transport system ATP-binding protein
LHAEGKTIIFVTHNPEIAGFSGRTIVLKDGRVMSDTANDHIESAAEILAKLPKNDE